jgi:hypothetical protein
MSDAFADLWNSSIPSKAAAAAAPSQPLGSLNQLGILRRPQQDIFSLLASSSAPSSRPLTPQRSSPQPPAKALNGFSGDAFSDLLSGTLGTSSSNANMTIAQRAAHAEQQRSANLQKHELLGKQHAFAWEGLDTLGAPKLSQSTALHSSDDWGLGAAVPESSTSSISASVVDDDWGLSDSSTQKVSSSKSSSQATSQSTFLEFEDLLSPQASSAPPPPDNFNFESRKDRDGWESNSCGAGDILGVLSKPVGTLPECPSPSVRQNLLSEAVCI